MPDRGILDGALDYLATLILSSIPLWLALLVILRRVAFFPSILLAGGDKRTQDRDIKTAIELARGL